eukprot:scaffold2432_cov63-Cyclotella_meneghiniana.AAC.4
MPRGKPLSWTAVRDKLIIIKASNGGSFKGLPESNPGYRFYQDRLREVRIKQGTQENTTGRNVRNVGQWIGPAVISELEEMEFPIDKPVNAAPGTRTNGSKEERNAYAAEWEREKHARMVQSRFSHMDAIETICVDDSGDSVSFNYVLDKNREACLKKVFDHSERKMVMVKRSNADELKGKPFVFPAHFTLRRVQDFQRDNDGNLLIFPYCELTAEQKEFANRPNGCGYEDDPPTKKCRETWMTPYLEGGAAWNVQRAENYAQLSKFVHDGGLFCIQHENGRVTYEMEMTVAILDVKNAQNIQRLFQTKIKNGNVGSGCELLSRKLGPIHPDTVGTARFVVWDSATDGRASNGKLVTHIRENAYQLLNLKNRKSFTVNYANGDMKNEINRDIDEGCFSFSQYKITYNPTEEDQKPAAASVMEAEAVPSVSNAPAAPSSPL